jgi:DNA replication ATP-dependent helicase Dna2
MQYRMNEDIMSLSNELVYGGRLLCGNREVAERTLRLPKGSKTGCKQPQCLHESCWIDRVVSEK